MAAEHFWPNQDPIGRRLSFTFEDRDGKPDGREVAGVVGHVKTHAPGGHGLPTARADDPGRPRTMSLVVRFASGTADGRLTVQSIIREIAPRLPIDGYMPMESIIRASFQLLWPSVFAVTAFGAMAMLLTMIGVYGLVSY